MKNIIICNNCKEENPFYSLICSNCKSFLRVKISNIDLWLTIAKILESPSNAIKNIIYAEHKNFVFLLLPLASIKISLISSIFTNALQIEQTDDSISFLSILMGGLVIFILIFFSSLIVTGINSILGLKNRLKDNFAVYTYSLIPIVLTLLILTPVEYALFGHYWFTFNPPPYIIKSTAAFILISIENIFILWTYLLLILSTYTQTKNIFYSIIIGTMLFAAIFILPVYLYWAS